MVDINLIGFLKSGKYRKKILIQSKNLLITPTEIANYLNLNISQVSRTLSELEKYGLVVCTTPYRSKGRIYKATEKGISILKLLGDD